MNAPTRQYVLQRVPVHNRAKVIVDDQELNDIIKSIKKYHIEHKKQYDDLSDEFWTGTAAGTSKQLFDFLKRYITYHVEPEHDQTIKSPGRLIKEGYGDCKHYASFICGIVDSLERKGYPISSCYRFVSDVPGKDVHHVFAVVYDKGNEYWNDPVLKTYNQRPNFHNIKDISISKGIGRLTYLSGTDQDAEMGAINFKKLVQSVKKGAQNTVKKVQKAATNVQHGMNVNAQNLKKGVKYAAKDVAKGAKNTVKKVTHVAVKVAAAPARNAFLALLDINAFNLAKRVANSSNKAGLNDAWKKLGGDPAKLAQAARNGLLFQAKMHKKNPKAIKGLNDCIGMGATYHSDMITTHPHRWVRDHYIRKHRRMRHGRRSTDPYNMAMIHGSMVGAEPVSVATLMTLASAVLAVLAKFLDMKQGEAEAMAAEAARGGAGIVDMATNVDAGKGEQQATTMENITMPQAGNDANMSINTGVDEYGQPQVTIQDVKHPALQNAASPDGGAGADVMPYADGAQPPAAPGNNGVDNFINEVKEGAKKYAKPALLTVGGVILLTKIVIPLAQGKKLFPKRR